ncbi:MAG: hypothetical protein R2909_06015 [Gemmatimonadales bacterium]
MVTKEDIQAFIDRLEGGSLESKEVEPGLWLVRAGSGAEIVVSYSPPVVILRVRVMEPPTTADKQTGLFRELLKLNASDLVHGSYGLEGNHVVLTDALELESLDYSEFEASFDSLSLALSSHLGALAPFRER